ncbi:MAG TPA: serine hydrolase [Caulobacteraceae bacterium]|jgi:CubicO group peptidase (beta-lactamase class C family)|nr:serine hydrolase [Caulobacteraceae bacterium]
MRTAVVSAVIAAIWAGAAAAAPGGQGTEQGPGARIDATFSAFNRTTPGCAVGVEQNGKSLFAKGYGMADLEHGIPITPKTMFYMASVSKQFTALTVLTLAKENKLALTDSVRKYVPELPAYADKITIYELLTHTSGLRDYYTLGSLAGLPDDLPYKEDVVLRMLAQQHELNFEPGTTYLYSNSGYFLLSVIVKRVTGKPLNAVARADLFDPLGMTMTRFQHDHSAIIPNKAYGYDLRDDAWHTSNSMNDVVGAGGLYSSIDDMFHWMDNFEDPKVGAEALAAMEAPGKLNDGKAIEYGMGLEPTTYRGLKVIEHGGALAGYRTEDMWFPSEKLSVVVLCNDGAASPGVFARTIADLFLKDAPKPAPAATELVAKPAVIVDAKLLDAYAGDYQVTPGLILSLVRDKDHLDARINAGGRMAMDAVSNTAFRMKEPQAEVDFAGAPGGAAETSAALHLGGSVLPMKRLDAPKPSAEQLAAYAGRFYSADLDVTYDVSAGEGGLQVRYPGGDLDLIPVGKDAFAARVGTVTFICTQDAPCDALSIDAGRALHMRFTRVTAR